MTAALTVLAGFIVFVGGQITQRFLLEPIQEQRKVIGEIAYVLLYHGNVGRFVPFESQQSREDIAATLRRLAGELRATRATIPVYHLLERTSWVPKTENVITASTHLVGWSNGVIGATEDTIPKHKEAIRESLAGNSGLGPVTVTEPKSASLCVLWITLSKIPECSPR